MTPPERADFPTPPDRVLARVPRGMPLTERILLSVLTADRGYPTRCWIWQKRVLPTGYGVMRLGGRKGRHRMAHLASHEAFVGPILPGLQVDHLCRVTECCNPAHLEAVTHQTNMRRSVRVRSAQCPQGHLYTPANMKPAKKRKDHHSDTYRCRACHNADTRRRRAARRNSQKKGQQ